MHPQRKWFTAALIIWIPFVVSSQAPFVVSSSNHERAHVKIRVFLKLPETSPIPDDRPVARPALRASASRMFATASCLRSALLFFRATPLMMWIPFVVSPQAPFVVSLSNHERNQDDNRSSSDALWTSRT